MAITSVTPGDVATSLGRTLTEAEEAQATLWIADANLLINARLGVDALLDQDILDYVVREAVVLKMKRPDEASQVEVAVDDARVSRRYERSTGQVTILDEWWALLSPATDSAAGFSTRPTFEMDTPPVDSWA